ncbi:helix-hairpin-helix domain-containing protein [Halosimplex carlsbadense]|uniref:helix-hairpin-helix domain-containing protein n=1 Tax=Halosimplex carlsbadense TaxID=171164 RepID=UPI001377D0D4|nr:helix-hairpin-helix domain-containing protein [Halosimplex carlsbadense]
MTEREQERAIARVVANIDGVSDRIIDGLDEEFSTPMAIAEASPNELQRVDGIGPAIARRIYRRTDSARKHPELHTTDIYGGRRERGFRG